MERISVHGLEELILLKCPYHPKQFIDSVQSLSEFQQHFSQKNGRPENVKDLEENKGKSFLMITMRYH